MLYSFNCCHLFLQNKTRCIVVFFFQTTKVGNVDFNSDLVSIFLSYFLFSIYNPSLGDFEVTRGFSLRKRSASCEQVLAAPSFPASVPCVLPWAGAQPCLSPPQCPSCLCSQFSVCFWCGCHCTCSEPGCSGRCVGSPHCWEGHGPLWATPSLETALAWVLWGAGFCTPWSCDSDLAPLTGQEPRWGSSGQAWRAGHGPEGRTLGWPEQPQQLTGSWGTACRPGLSLPACGVMPGDTFFCPWSGVGFAIPAS